MCVLLSNLQKQTKYFLNTAQSWKIYCINISVALNCVIEVMVYHYSECILTYVMVFLSSESETFISYK